MSVDFNAQVLKLLNDIQTRLSIIESKVNSNSTDDNNISSSTSSVVSLPKSIIAFDEYITTYLNPFIAICTKLGGGALESGLIIKDGWNEMRKYLLMASSCKEPPQAKLNTLLGTPH